MTTVDRTKLYGILHQLDGKPIERQVRVLKVGIGVPVGPDVHVWIDGQGQWSVETGVYPNGKRQSQIQRFGAREQAELYYLRQRKSAPERKAPRKIPYFTFLEMDGRGQFVHDFDTIEQHGATPTEIDVVFLTETNFDASFQAWSISKLLCEGDGRNARRHIEWAQNTDEKRLAQEARAAGERFFPMLDACFARGCPFARGEKPACKPHGRLYFQLVHAPRIGGACQFDTTGYRSIAQLSSSLQQIRSLTGHGNSDTGTVAGIPLKLVLRPYRVQHQGQSSIQYGVSLEFRAKSVGEMARLLQEHTTEFRQITQLPAASPPITDSPNRCSSEESAWTEESPIPAQASSSEGTILEGESEDPDTMEAAAMSAEFYGDFPSEEPDGSPLQNAHAEPSMPRRKSETRLS